MDGRCQSPAETARRLGVPLDELMRLQNGRAALTPRLAAKLEAAGWSNVPFWLRLQEAYDQAQARQRLEAQSATTLPMSVPSAS